MFTWCTLSLLHAVLTRNIFKFLGPRYTVAKNESCIWCSSYRRTRTSSSITGSLPLAISFKTDTVHLHWHTWFVSDFKSSSATDDILSIIRGSSNQLSSRSIEYYAGQVYIFESSFVSSSFALGLVLPPPHLPYNANRYSCGISANAEPSTLPTCHGHPFWSSKMHI
jgi:hypothetical protein